MQNIHEGHRKRLRAKYIRNGALNLEEHELLELLLFYSYRRANTNEIAHRLIDSFGSLAGVFEAPVEDLLKVDGIGEQSAILISMIYDMYTATQISKLKKYKFINDSEALINFLSPYYLNKHNEMPSALFLDAKKKVLDFHMFPEGSFKSAFLDLKIISEKAIRLNAAYVVLAHNHPSGLALPSTADKDTTLRLSAVLRGLGIQILDHIIFSDNDYVSMAESGILDLDTSSKMYFGISDAK